MMEKIALTVHIHSIGRVEIIKAIKVVMATAQIITRIASPHTHRVPHLPSLHQLSCSSPLGSIYHHSPQRFLNSLYLRF